MGYLIDLCIIFTIYGMLAYSLYMLEEESRTLMISLILFFVIGTYSTAFWLIIVGMNVFPTIAIAVVAGCIIGSIIFALVKHYSSNYYAIMGLGVVIIILSMTLTIKGTKGPLGAIGLDGSFKREYGFSPIELFLFCLGLFFTSYMSKKILQWLPIGQEFEMMSLDKQLSSTRAKRYRRINYLIALSLATIAGSCYATYIGYVDAHSYQLKEGIFLFMIMVIGGLRSISLAIIGIGLLIAMPELLKYFGIPYSVAVNMQMIIYGLIATAMLISHALGFLGIEPNYDNLEDFE